MRAELREHQERLRQLHARNNTGKRCGRCRGWLSFEAFRPDSRSANGWSSYCNDCAAAADREWRERHSGYVGAYNERRRLEYAEQQREDEAANVFGVRRGVHGKAEQVHVLARVP